LSGTISARSRHAEMKDTRKKRSDQSEMGLILENLTQRGAREVILMVVAHRRLPHWRHQCLLDSQQSFQTILVIPVYVPPECSLMPFRAFDPVATRPPRTTKP
jgi:hypothetical protein